MKKLFIALISVLSANANVSTPINVDQIKNLEALVIEKLSKSMQNSSVLLITNSLKLNEFKDYILNKATPDEIKSYAAYTIGAGVTLSVVALYLSYKLLKCAFYRNPTRVVVNDSNGKAIAHGKVEYV